MAKRVCIVASCPNLTSGTRCCPAHQRQYEQARGSRQARSYGADWQRLRLEVLDRDNYACRIGRPGCKRMATTVDHIVAKVNGGTDDPANLRAACEWCNKSKGGRPS